MVENKREARYERSDVPPRLLALLAGGLALAVAVVLAGVALAFRAALVPTPAHPTLSTGTEPRLESDPYRDRAAYAQAQRQLLRQYGWTPDGHVRVPVDRAMRNVASQGWSEGQ